MRKPLLILAATAVLASGTAFAATTTKTADQTASQSASAKHKAKKKTGHENAAPAKKAE